MRIKILSASNHYALTEATNIFIESIEKKQCRVLNIRVDVVVGVAQCIATIVYQQNDHISPEDLKEMLRVPEDIHR